ncbi:MAG: ferredoxin III, nif-specific [Nitrospirae bacterium]|nr:ferredoxin III, nif-specific [Nitrospirota bacterium]MBI5695489.1 ferredoxin III, nif-specific [Nitrospirota bacterium]
MGATKGGKDWTPEYVVSIDHGRCIGCGRCFKVCGRSVLELVEKPFDGDDEFGDDMGNKVMSVKDADDCIGCGACARTCTKKCYTHAPA